MQTIYSEKSLCLYIPSVLVEKELALKKLNKNFKTWVLLPPGFIITWKYKQSL